MKKSSILILTALCFFTLGSAIFVDIVPKFQEVSGRFPGLSISGDTEFIYGDFDSDGDVDIHAYKKDALENDFFRNDGSGNFSKVTGSQNPFNNLPAKAAFDNAQYAFVADWDNDGDDDILVTGRGENNPRKNIFYKNNSGVFQELEGAASPFNGITIANETQLIYGDFDSDGDIDLHTYVTNAAVNDFWSNNGNGTFTNVTGTANPFDNLPDKAAFYLKAQDAYVADWDNDGDDDVFVVRRQANGDKVFCRNDNGKFVLVTGAASPFSAMSIAQETQFTYGDFDSDGDIDLQTWDMSNPIQTWLNNGSGTFANVTNLNTNPFENLAGKATFFNSATYAHVADWDNDGDDDVFTSNRTAEGQNLLYVQSGSAPKLQSSTPANGATGFAVDGNIVLNFSAVVTPVSGKNITIKRTGNNATFATIAATNVQGGGTSTITIDPSSDLDGTTGYYIVIDEGAFKDGQGRAYGGINASNQLAFTTGAVAVAPTVTTNAVTNYALTSAVLGGSVISDGGAGVSDRGIVWSTSPTPTVLSNKVGIGSGTGSFSQNITSLPAGTHIYVRAYAINPKGTSYGNEVDFYTKTNVTSITRQVSSPTNAATVQYEVVFAQAVTGVNATSFTLVTGGITGAAVSAISGSGTTYIVTVNTGSGNGAVRLDFTSPAGVTPNAEAAFTTAESYTVYKLSQPSDYYRNKNASTDWHVASGWQSSQDNSFWIDATSAPGSGATETKIAAGATVTLPGGITSANNVNNAGILDTGTGLLFTTGTFTGNGEVKGNGNILYANFTNTGTVSPGNSPGILTFTGDFSNTGAINIELGGTATITGYDQLFVTGTLTAGGTINVSLINGFAPALGDEFTIIDAGALSGTFPTINLPSVAPKIWETTYDASNGTLKLKVVNDPMPVTLVHFEAVKESGAVKLVWSTSEESNSSHFEINRSNDGKNWVTLGRVAASGESKQVVDYRFDDAEPAAGMNYYRLKMVDFDETFAYSRIREAAFGAKEQLVLYPNPVQNELYIKGKSGSSAEVWDAAGRLRLRGNLDHGRMNVQSLPAGVYQLRVQGIDGQEEVRRFVIVR
uniref:FG-GAP-like repeat-containing protein n=1 Tax=Dyadobacter sp. SG02 TaxID=1855291 RepID=UPI0008C813BC|nr:FG-GAP-like repeat-containing protein [Dyadobacter sp. SG02]SEI59214.1 Por secretion system C-terminal sorting domain-containing protein [Dyadobacter sp. SG02]